VLAERGDEVKVLAGGQSLIPMMKLRLANPTTLMDINRLPDLNNIGESNGHLTFGALVRHNDVVKSELAGRSNHTVFAAAPWIADPIVRNLGTVCGSLAHHDPEGDWASVMLAAGAELVLSNSEGERVVPITEFLVDMFSTSCQPNELVTEVRVNKHTTRGGGDYQKLERKIGDYATVGVATSLELGDDGAITGAGIALTSVYPYNLKVTEVEDLLVGNQPGDDLFKEAGAIAAAASDPASDHRGSADYKRHVVGVFVERGLANSLATAQGGQS
jgi:carbon-monoxide dehydrogenase medium subunit